MNGESTVSSTHKEVIEILKKVPVGDEVVVTVTTADDYDTNYVYKQYCHGVLSYSYTSL